MALRLAGDAPDAPHMAAAANSSGAGAALEPARVFTRIWLALFGQWSWDEVPELPPEMVFLPKWFPLNVYDWGCWARQTVVPLTIVGAHPPGAPAAVQRRRAAHRTPRRRRRRSRGAGTVSSSGSTACSTSTGVGRSVRYASWPCAGAAEWILARQETDGSLGRHPAAVGLLAPRAAPAGLSAGPPGAAGRPRRAGRLHDPRGDPGRLGPPAGGLPVAGLGHRRSR